MLILLWVSLENIEIHLYTPLTLILDIIYMYIYYQYVYYGLSIYMYLRGIILGMDAADEKQR